MANMIGKRDKRTAEQRHNDSITGRDDLKPSAINRPEDFVTTGPVTGKEDERAEGTEEK